ncbi:MAG: patatin-like phospholipase family protein [Luteolibacter sp.]
MSRERKISRSLIPSLVAFPFIISGCAEITYPFNRAGRMSFKVSPSSETEAPLGSWNPDIAKREEKCSPGEAAYIRSRRISAGSLPSGPLIGVAFSGGGVRSATVNLGVLQGLEDRHVLQQVDYLSCVSGGSYIGGWYASHLRSPSEMKDLKLKLQNDSKALANFSSSRQDLLEFGTHSNCRAVNNIRERGGMFGDGKTEAWNITKAAGWWTLTFVPNLIIDVGVHFQPLPGKFNMTHPFYAYRNQLEHTYFMGWDGILKATPGKKGISAGSPNLARDINSRGSQAPYLICNGALANSERSASDGDGKPTYPSDTHNFEFTRDRCGSPLIGWIPTPLFDHTVTNVNRPQGAPIETEVLKGPLPRTETKPFPLSTAVAASGAAVDSAAIGAYKTKQFVNTCLGVVNANLRYQTSNFNQDHTLWWQRPYDRLREITTDRLTRSPRSNTLQISDGGHFENLAVYGLLRRDIPVILAFDAGQDGKYEYSDLRRLLQLIRQCGWVYEWDGNSEGELNKPGRPKREEIVLPYQFVRTPNAGYPPENPIWHFRVKKPSGKICSVWYVKNSFRSTDPASRWGNDLRSFKDNSAELKSDFPHIGTFRVDGWEQPRFDIYREIGRLLARRVSDEAKAARELR